LRWFVAWREPRQDGAAFPSSLQGDGHPDGSSPVSTLHGVGQLPLPARNDSATLRNGVSLHGGGLMIAELDPIVLLRDQPSGGSPPATWVPSCTPVGMPPTRWSS
jgi:hypothetical protein